MKGLLDPCFHLSKHGGHLLKHFSLSGLDLLGYFHFLLLKFKPSHLRNLIGLFQDSTSTFPKGVSFNNPRATKLDLSLSRPYLPNLSIHQHARSF